MLYKGATGQQWFVDIPQLSLSVLPQSRVPETTINFPQSIISPLPFCVWLAAHWGAIIRMEDGVRWHGYRSDEWRNVIYPTRQRSPMIHVPITIFPATCRRSWRWRFFNRGKYMARLLRSPISTVSAQLCPPKQVYLDLNSFGLTAEQLSGAEFALPSGQSLTSFFFLITRERQTLCRQLLVSPSSIIIS